jgi:glycosyltransferase involved in cell wall biosynthesis
MPLVSVLTLSHNYGCFLREHLDSIQAQTFRDFENIIINAGSDDETADIAYEYSKRFSTVKTIDVLNFGVSTNRNLGLAKALGQYVVSLDADDRIAPTFLETLLVHAGPKTLVCPGMHHGFNDEHGSGGPGEGFSLQDILNANRIFCCTMFPRAACEAVGGYDARLDWAGCEDWNLWARLMKYGCTFRAVHDLLFYYRVHPESNTLRCINRGTWNTNMVAQMNHEWQPA